MKHYFLFIMLLCLQQITTACSNNENDEEKSYSYGYEPQNWADSKLWFEGDKRLADIDSSEPDVFYLLPTCLTAWQDSTGLTHYNADPTNARHVKAWKLSAQLADTIFASRANLFMPYYRQAVFEGLQGEHADEAMYMATQDALESFDYYLKHYNNGRPFILAGYSQGGKMVTEILKHIDDATYKKLIAAYVVGFGVTAADTVTQKGHRTSHVKLAKDESSEGVTVNFNSVTSTDVISQLLCAGNVGCINPVSWTTTSTPATLLAVGETPKADDTHFHYGTAVVPADASKAVTVKVDQTNHVLVVDNIDPQRYFLSSLSSFFSVGNLHLQELFFYGDYLRRNVLLRSNMTVDKK